MTIITTSYPLPLGNVTLVHQAWFSPSIYQKAMVVPGVGHRTHVVHRRNPSTILQPTREAHAGPRRFTGAEWWAAAVLAFCLILLTGLLAGLTLGVMSVDMTMLRVWMKTGSNQRQYVIEISFNGHLRRLPNKSRPPSYLEPQICVAPGLHHEIELNLRLSLGLKHPQYSPFVVTPTGF